MKKYFDSWTCTEPGTPPFNPASPNSDQHLMCSSRQNPYPPRGRSSEIPRGRGVLKVKILEAKYEAKLKFLGGDRGCKTKTLPWGEYGYFLELMQSSPLCRKGDKNKWNDHQRLSVLVVKQILTNCTIRNTWSTVKRIYMLVLGLKGLILYCSWSFSVVCISCESRHTYASLFHPPRN